MALSPSILFFSPYAGIWLHAMPEALVAAALQRAGAKVLYAVCDGVYNEGCIVMSAHRLSAASDAVTRERVCKQCRKQRDLFTQKLDVPTVAIDGLLNKNDMAKIQSIVDDVQHAEEIEHVFFKGLPAGRYAIHETIIHYKLTALNEMTTAAMKDFRLKLKHVLITLTAGEKILEQHSPNRIVTYNTHISTNFALMNLAEKRSIPTFGLHAGGNMSDRFATLYVFRKDMVVLFQGWIEEYLKHSNSLPTTAEGIKNTTQHFLALASGQTAWVYSKPKSSKYFSIRDYFGITSDQKVLLATLSSYDELYSSQMMGVMKTYPLIFQTQVEWMKAVISYVEKEKGLFLIIRVHPRELPNIRDKVHSRHAQMLAEELKNLPQNIRVNWPSDNISLYDLTPQVDVGLNGWSSTGKELAMLGIPVVLYTKDILYYPHSLNILAANQNDYFLCIEKALHEGWSFDRVKQVYRWLAVEYTLGTISIKDQFIVKEGARSFWQRALNKIKQLACQKANLDKLKNTLKEERTFTKAILEDVSIVDLQLAKEARLTEQEEDALIRKEIEKLLGSVYQKIPAGYSNTIDSLRKAVRDRT